MEKIVEKIRKFVAEECEKHTLGKEIYLNHFIPVLNYSKELARGKNLDLEIIKIAALLHDIGSIIYGRENHHITGAEIAEKKLRDFGYPEKKIKKIKQCILNHRGSVKNKFNSIEEQIIAEADCLTFFDNLEGTFLWVIEADKVKNQKKIRMFIRQKIQNKWNQLSPDAKEIIKDKFEAAMLLFG